LNQQLINSILSTDLNKKLIIYGMNACDESLNYKYNQLAKLGFSNMYVYVGGLFEWLLLQDIYGDDNFPTTKKEPDILKYKGDIMSKKLMLTY